MRNRWDPALFSAIFQPALEAAPISQAQVADRAGVSHSQLSRWKEANHRPDYDNLAAIGAVLEELLRRPGFRDELLDAAGYDASLEPVSPGDDGSQPPHFADPAEQRIARQVWEANAAADPALRRGFVALAIRMHRKRLAARRPGGRHAHG